MIHVCLHACVCVLLGWFCFRYAVACLVWCCVVCVCLVCVVCVCVFACLLCLCCVGLRSVHVWLISCAWLMHGLTVSCAVCVCLSMGCVVHVCCGVACWLHVCGVYVVG